MATSKSGDGSVKNGQPLILWEKKIGYVLARSFEDKGAFEGLAFLHVTVNSEALPGVYEMVINTNTWEVWDAEDPVILKRIVKAHVRPFSSR